MSRPFHITIKTMGLLKSSSNSKEHTKKNVALKNQMFNLPYWIGEIHHETNTRSPILTNDNNLVTAELQRLREKQVNYSDKHTTKSLNFEINNKVRHKVDHRPCEGAQW